MKLKLVLYLPYKDAVAAATAAAATSMMAIKGIDDFFSSFFLFYGSVWHFAFLSHNVRRMTLMMKDIQGRGQLLRRPFLCHIDDRFCLVRFSPPIIVEYCRSRVNSCDLVARQYRGL